MVFLWRNGGEGLKACYSGCCIKAFITLSLNGLCMPSDDGWKDVVHSYLQTHPCICSISLGGRKARGEPDIYSVIRKTPWIAPRGFIVRMPVSVT